MEESRAVVRRLYEQVFNQGNLQVADELVADDHVLHDPNLPGDSYGPEAVKSIAALIRKISPDIRYVIEDEIAEGDKVVARWTASGTLANEMRTAALADNEVALSGISIYYIKEDMIMETRQLLQPLPEESEAAPTPREQIREFLKDEGDETQMGRFCCKYISQACCP